jgi:hypothetical protein
MSEVEEGFRIDSFEKAAWAMRKYRALAQRLEQNRAMAQREHDRINAWLDRVQAPVCSQLEFYEQHLSAWALGERRQGRKSVDFPDGTIKTRTVAASFEVDKTVFVEWAEESKRDDLLRVSLSPNMTAIKSSFVVDSGTAVDPATGEKVPGLYPVPENVSIKFEPDMEACDLEGEEDAVDE